MGADAEGWASMWLVASVAVVLAGIMVAVAALAEPHDRTVPDRLGVVTPHELRTARFPMVWRGYDPGHVDAMLARAAAALEDALHYGSRTPAEGGELPGFLAETFEDDAEEQAASEADEPQVTGSGEELEDAGGDGPGGLDR